MLTRTFLLASVLLNSTSSTDNSTLDDSGTLINIYQPTAKDVHMSVNALRTIVFASLAITFAVIGGALLAHRCTGSDYLDVDTRRALENRRSEDRRALLPLP